MKQWKKNLALIFAAVFTMGNVICVPAAEIQVSSETVSEESGENLFSDTEVYEETVQLSEEAQEEVEEPEVSPEPETEIFEEDPSAEVLEEEDEGEFHENVPAEPDEGDSFSFSDGEQAAFETETEENTMPDAGDSMSGDWSYTTQGSKATITKYSGSDVTVTIPEKIGTYTVTAIKAGAFAGNTKLETVSVPSTVTELGSSVGNTGVFQECTNLKYVILSEGSDAAYIGSNCFYNCSSLQEISIPKNYEKICYRAFSGCISMRNVTITSSGSAVPNQEIGDRAFEGCKSLESIYIPPTVKFIGICAFQDCKGLTSLTLSEGLQIIDRGAFSECTKLSAVTIPSTVTQIGSTNNYAGVFENCTALRTLTIRQGESDAYIGDRAFRGCSSLQAVSVPQNYTEIHYMAFADCISLTEVKIAASTAVYANQFIENNAFDSCTNLKTVTIPGTVKSIGYWAFRNCGNLVSVSLGEGIESIDRGAFAECKKLTSITIPGSVTVLGSENNTTGVFENCTALTTVTLVKGSDPAFIGDNTFKNCVSLSKITIPGNYLRIHYQAFRGCTGLTSMVYQNSGASYCNQGIDPYAFAECSKLASVTVPGTVEYIYEFAFQKDTALKKLTLNNGIKNIRYGAFAGCTSLETVTVPGTVNTIGSTAGYTGAFQDCTALYKVNILANENGDTGFILGQNTFKNCSSLTYVYIPESFTKFYISAFTGTNAKLTIWGVEGSKADDFATANNIPFNQVNVATPRISKLANVSAGIQITWKAAEQAKSYVVYRRVKGENIYKSVGKTSKLTYTDTKVTSGTTYEYTLVGINGSNRSDYLKNNGSLKYLSMPKNIKVSNKAGYTALGWSSVKGAESYVVYRKTDGGKWTRVGITRVDASGDSATGTSLVDRNVEEGTDYIYTVKACAGKVASAYDADGVANRYLGTVKIDSLTNTKSGVMVEWEAAEGAGGYQVYRKTAKGKFTRIAKLSGGSAISYCDETAVNGKGYSYVVRPYWGTSYGTYEEAKTVRLTAVSITSAVNSAAKTIQVSWKKNSKVTGYQIKYVPSSGSSKVVYSDEPSVKLKNMKKGVTYKIYVRGYRTVSGKKYFAPWSSAKSVKVTK